MSQADVYNAYRIGPSHQRQIEGFTRQAMTASYRAEIRRELGRLGYGDRPVTVTDPASLKALSGTARAYATSIRRTFNQYLGRALTAQPPTSTDAQRAAGLATWRDSTRSYNANTLGPNIEATARGMAIDHFYANNPGIGGQWSVDGAMQCPRCQEAGAGDRSIALPNHRNCGCRWVYTPDTSTLPAFEDLWTGATQSKRLRLVGGETAHHYARTA